MTMYLYHVYTAMSCMEAIVKVKTQKGNKNIAYCLKFLLGVYGLVIVRTVSIALHYRRHWVPVGFICLVDV